MRTYLPQVPLAFVTLLVVFANIFWFKKKNKEKKEKKKHLQTLKPNDLSYMILGQTLFHVL